MNVLDLKAEIARCDLTIPKLAEIIGIDIVNVFNKFLFIANNKNLRDK